MTHCEYTLDTLLDVLADPSVVEGRQDQYRIVHLADTKSSYVLGGPESVSGTTVANPVSSIRYCTVLYCTFPTIQERLDCVVAKLMESVRTLCTSLIVNEVGAALS
jgi:hypothetical protein